MSVLIRQAKVVDPQSEFHNKVVDIFIKDGAVRSIGASLKDKAEQELNGKDLCVSQGWVDIFADYREPGYEQKETIASGLDAAAAGGFTDVFLVPNTQPAVSTKSVVQYIQQKAAGHTVRVRPLGTISQDAEGKALAEMLDMHANGAVAFSDGWKPVQQSSLMLKALEYARSFNGVLIQIPLDAALSAGGLMHEGELSTRLGMAGIPVLAETVQLHRDLELLRYTGSKLHVTGVSTAAGVEMIRQAKAEGLQLTCSVTPYHLALTDAALEGYDSVYKVTPVLRSEEDRQALIAGLKDGTIDCITSHHRPQEWDAKAKEFEYAGEGMNLQEVVFPVVLGAVQGQVPLERIIDALAVRPRQIFALPGQALGMGYEGGLTVFSTDDGHELNRARIRSASHNNPFIGRTLNGRVSAIVNNSNVHLNQ